MSASHSEPLDPIAIEKVHALFGGAFSSLGMRVLYATFDSQAFGNWFALVVTRELDIRVDCDRGDVELRVRGTGSALDWLHMDPVRAYLTQEDLYDPWDGVHLAQFLVANYGSIAMALSPAQNDQTRAAVARIGDDRYKNFVARCGDPTPPR